MGVDFIIDDKFNLEVEVNIIKELYVFYELVKIMWVLIFVFGLMLVYFGEVYVLLLGGCVIGSWLVDLYIYGLWVMGVDIEVENGYIHASVKGCLRGVRIVLEIVMVIGIENLMMVVVLVEG